MIASLLLMAGAIPVLPYDVGNFGENVPVYTVPTRGLSSSSILLWPRGVKLRVEERGDELVVHFDRPVDEKSVARFNAEAGGHVQSLRWNDDSLLLRANAGVRLSPRVENNRLLVTFAGEGIDQALPLPTQASGEGSNEASTARDIAMVSIRADLASGFVGRARRQAERLAREYPKDVDVMRLMADTQAVDGDHATAARHYRSANAKDRSVQRTMALAPGSVSLGATIRDGSGFTQTEVALGATVAVHGRASVGGSIRRVDTHAAAAVVGGTLSGKVEAEATVADLAATAQITPQLRVDFTGGFWLETGVAGGGARLVYGSSDTQLRIGYATMSPTFPSPSRRWRTGFCPRLTSGGRRRYCLNCAVVWISDGGVTAYRE